MSHFKHLIYSNERLKTFEPKSLVEIFSKDQHPILLKNKDLELQRYAIQACELKEWESFWLYSWMV